MSNRKITDGLLVNPTILEKERRYRLYTHGSLSQALEIAISDLEAIEEANKPMIDMDSWAYAEHPYDEPCSLCLAGAALYRTCNLRSRIAIDGNISGRECMISYVARGGFFAFKPLTEEQTRMQGGIDRTRKQFGSPKYGDENFKTYLRGVVNALRDEDC